MSQAKLDLLTEYGIDLDTGCLHIDGAVDEEMYRKFLRGLAVLNKTNRNKPVKVIFNTEGGSVEQSLAIYDLIKGSPRPVTILVNGPCYSAGIMVLAAAARRLATKSSRFLWHFGPRVATSKSEHEQEIADHNLYIVRTHGCTNLPLDVVSFMYDGETYFNAAVAHNYGLVQKIVSRL